MIPSFRKILFGTVFALTITACDDTAPDLLTRASEAVADRDYATAQQLCDSLSRGTPADTLSVTGLCRVASLYMQIAEHRDTEANVASSALCIEKALRTDSAAVIRFIATMPPEQQATVVLPMTLVNYSATPNDLSEFAEPVDAETADSLNRLHHD